MGFEPILRFGVMSDVHYTAECPHRREHFKDALATVYSYAEKQDYKEVDALYVVGDFVDTGRPEQMEWLKEDMDACLKPETLLVMTLANHELHYVESEQQALADFDRIFGLPLDRHEIIKGYHFISITTTRDKGQWHDSFNDAKRKFLKTELKKAAADSPDRPIFVFQHPGVKGTTPGALLGNLGIYDILAEYPGVIDFSGHSHMAANDPREIFQKDFTAISTGSIAYISLCNKWCYKELGTRGHTNRDHSHMLIVEVDEKGTVCVKVVDAVAKRVFDQERIIDVSGGKAGFTYTADRTEPDPYFAAGSAAELACEADTVRLTFPQAFCSGSRVWCYNVRFFGENGEPVYEENIPSDHMDYKQKDFYEFSFEELPQGISSAEIRAVGFFGNVSQPLTARVK